MIAPAHLRVVSQWLTLGAIIGVLCGAASALFLWLLDLATETRTTHEVLVFTLPLAGLAIGWLYARWGRPITGGSKRVIDAIREDEARLPKRMAPMILLGTVLTHLFGGSAGREGTAVQMGASLTDTLAHQLRVSPELRRQLLAAGVAGGFGSVFGTPIAGAIFGMELVIVGRLDLRALLPALTASVVGDLTTRGLGIGHTPYPTLAPLELSPLLLGQWALFALAIAAVTLAFITLTDLIKRAGERWLPALPLRMMAGGALVVLLYLLVGTADYLGLGVPTIVRALSDPDLPIYAFALKLVFTAVTIGTGFLGGEVTPLFFIGATLGNALGPTLGLPLPMAAAVGLAAVFATAAKTPLALSIMAVELFGAHVLPHALIVCVLASLLTGHRSIYPRPA